MDRFSLLSLPFVFFPLTSRARAIVLLFHDLLKGFFRSIKKTILAVVSWILPSSDFGVEVPHRKFSNAQVQAIFDRLPSFRDQKDLI